MRTLFLLLTISCVWLQQLQHSEARVRGESSALREDSRNDNYKNNIIKNGDDHQIYHRKAKARFQSIQRKLVVRYSIATGGGAGGEFRSMRRSQSMRDPFIDPPTTSSSSTFVPTPSPTTAASAVVLPPTPLPTTRLPTTRQPTPLPTPSPTTRSPTPLPTPLPQPTPLPTIAFNFDSIVSFNTRPPTLAPTVPPQPTPVPTRVNSSGGGGGVVSGPTFLPTPAQRETGRTCPTPTSGAWQDLANANAELKSCKVDADCGSYFPEDGPACCAYPYCVCATLYEFYDREFKCIGF